MIIQTTFQPVIGTLLPIDDIKDIIQFFKDEEISVYAVDEYRMNNR